jgi:hypothetical protein
MLRKAVAIFPNTAKIGALRKGLRGNLLIDNVNMERKQWH